MEITEEQLSVVKIPFFKRTLVEAGPGTGKTEVVARRLAWLLGPDGGLTPNRTLVLSFSRSAVKALIQRIRSVDLTESKVMSDLRHLSVRTFDSWSFRQLRFLGHEPIELLKDSHNENIRKLVAELEKRDPEEIRNNAKLGLKRIKHIVIDEFQDLTGLRAGLVFRLLALVTPSAIASERIKCGFTVLGDPNQTIYDWMCRENPEENGSMTSKNLIEWIKSDYCNDLIIKKLTKNHRSTDEIDGLVKKAAEILQTPAKEGLSKFQELHDFATNNCAVYDIDDVAMKITESDVCSCGAVLCRSNSEALEAGLVLEKHPLTGNLLIETSTGDKPKKLPSWIAKIFYRFKGAQVTRSHFKKICETLTSGGMEDLPCDGDWEAAWKILLDFARQGDGDTSISLDRFRERIMWKDSLPDDEGEKDPEVVITTIHKSKGLEYDLVSVVHSDDREEEPESHVEEAKILFVAMSRAKAELGMLELDKIRKFYHEKFDGGGRSRWYRRLPNGQRELEIGLDGDGDINSYVSISVFENEVGVENYQKFLEKYEKTLIGKKLILEKKLLPGETRKFIYEILLKEPFEGQRFLGRTRELVTYDLLKLKHENQYLPKYINGLKVRSIVTVIGTKIDEQVPAPWSKSRMWLGIDFHGIGRYKANWKKSY